MLCLCDVANEFEERQESHTEVLYIYLRYLPQHNVEYFLKPNMNMFVRILGRPAGLASEVRRGWGTGVVTYCTCVGTRPVSRVYMDLVLGSVRVTHSE